MKGATGGTADAHARPGTSARAYTPALKDVLQMLETIEYVL